MYRITILVLLSTFSSLAVIALPLGLRGPSVGIAAGGLTDGYVTAEYDFEISKYVCVGPEFGLGFSDGMALYIGGAGRLYIIPEMHDVFQPHVFFGAGFAHRFEDDGGDIVIPALSGAYLIAGPGCDFDIPGSPVSPYCDIGGFFFFGDESDSDFKAEVGVRVEL